jgi:hypothetical protein
METLNEKDSLCDRGYLKQRKETENAMWKADEVQEDTELIIIANI